MFENWIFCELDGCYIVCSKVIVTISDTKAVVDKIKQESPFVNDRTLVISGSHGEEEGNEWVDDNMHEDHRDNTFFEEDKRTFKFKRNICVRYYTYGFTQRNSKSGSQ